MSIANGQNGRGLPSGHSFTANKLLHHHDDAPARIQTPLDGSAASVPEASDTEEDITHAMLAEIYRKGEEKITEMFVEDGSYNYDALDAWKRIPAITPPLLPTTDHEPIREPPRKKAKRSIDEDDYDDDDEEDEDEDEDEHEDSQSLSQTKADPAAAAAKSLLSPSKSGSSPVHSVTSPGKQTDKSKDSDSQEKEKTSEDARKALEAARNATEENAKRSFHTLFYTLENDRTAMLEQQRLEESEKQLQAEIEKNNSGGGANSSGENHGSLSSANLGASRLTLKHLIGQLDMKRNKVRLSDSELRSLMNEVRKNRSKWASDENVGQEELYEAVEKVLSELKGHTEYSTPFLQRVNKRDAPDYYNFIKQPMDLGTMTKKLKQLQYKSKAEFVTDLNLIWDNCLRYNQDMNHPLRRMANGMRKEAEKLIPLIPDITIRPRAEVEAEERRKQNGGDDDAGDDSDDEPIMSSRGRKAGTKGGTKSRKAPSDQKESTPNADQKPILQLNGLLAKNREGSEAIDGSNGFGTPPIGGSSTPSGMNGHSALGSNADAMDIDGPPSLNGIALGHALGEAAEQVYEDEEYKFWKQFTKKDRAAFAKRNFELFKGNKLNVEEPALLRSKALMNRFLKNRKRAEANGIISHTQTDPSVSVVKESAKAPETLAEGMEDEVERNLPDYYDPLGVIPDILPRLQWIEDSEGQVINQHEEFLRLVPPGYFTAPTSKLTRKIDANIRQMQETRKLCSKIGVIKQMQIQTQIYSNQFPKYNPEPFVEQDIEGHFVCGDGAVMAPEVCRSAMQRSVAKLFYHAGFEELQPSALETVTDIAADYFHRLVRTFNIYREADKVPAVGAWAERGARFQPKFSMEETILHTLDENGFSVEDLEAYVKDDVDRLTSKLGTLHDRMKSHLADLLRPAINDAGPDGAGAFNDGSEQFVGGDFAEELGEDFFGFKALGLDSEMGGMLSVPLHLLHSRVRNTYQAQTQTSGVTMHNLVDDLQALPPLTNDNVGEEISLVKNFFLAKLHANGDQPLVEDEDLPIKQRRPRPRLGATGKIVSPQKRPPKEQIALAKKKKKLESGAAQVTDGKGANVPPDKGGVTASAKKKTVTIANGVGASNPALVLPPPMEKAESMHSHGNASQAEKDNDGGMPSPASLPEQ